MGVLERYLQLKNEGKNENEIISLLQEEGFSMAEIRDAANQAAIKNAISSTPQEVYDTGSYQIEQTYPSYEQQYYDNFSVDTTTEIIEQIVSKKMKDVLEGINTIKREKIYLEKEIENIKERLKRIEEGFDFLQRAIIGKIGEFENNSKIIQRDLENIHGTMSKLMNPLIDTYNELRRYKEKDKSAQ